MEKDKVSKEELLVFLKTMKNVFDVINKKTNKALRDYYEEDVENIKREYRLKSLYPNLLDPAFNFKIFKRKEFNDLKFETFGKNVIEESEKLCNS